MLMRTRHLLKKLKPKSVSLVRIRLCVPDCREELLGDAPALKGLSPTQGILKIISRLPKREMCSASSLASQNETRSRHSLVKRVPNILDRIGSEASEIFREVPDELYFDLVESRLAVQLGPNSVGIACDELRSKRIEILKMTQRAAQ